MVRRRIRPGIGCLVVALMAGGACVDTERLLGNSPEPALYLVLTRPDPGQSTPDSSLYGLLVTAGSPIASTYRNPESLTLTRQSDGLTYGWGSLARSGPVPRMNNGVTLSAEGNLQLPWDASVLGAGRESLTEGETYQLQLVTGGRTVTGTTRIPALPVISIRSDPSGSSVHWSKATHAAAYYVIVDTDDPPAFVTTDTSFVPLFNRPLDQRPSPARVRVIAMDANLAAFVSDTTLSSSGLVGALGVFGGSSRASAELPNVIASQAFPVSGTPAVKPAAPAARGLPVSPSPRGWF
jgi:hypothetical protein